MRVFTTRNQTVNNYRILAVCMCAVCCALCVCGKIGDAVSATASFARGNHDIFVADLKRIHSLRWRTDRGRGWHPIHSPIQWTQSHFEWTQCLNAFVCKRIATITTSHNSIRHTYFDFAPMPLLPPPPLLNCWIECNEYAQLHKLTCIWTWCTRSLARLPRTMQIHKMAWLPCTFFFGRCSFSFSFGCLNVACVWNCEKINTLANLRRQMYCT